MENKRTSSISDKHLIVEGQVNEKECEIVRMVADGFVGIIADSIKDKLSS